MSCACGHDHGHHASGKRPAPAPGQIAITGQLICASADQLAIILDHAPTHVALTRAEPGCLHFSLEQTRDPMVWQLEELFADADALKAHGERMAGGEWMQVSKDIRRDIHRIDG